MAFTIPTGKVHQAKALQSIQNEGCSRKGGRLYFTCDISSFSFEDLDQWLVVNYKFDSCRFQNSQFHHMKNAKGNFAFPNGHKGKG